MAVLHPGNAGLAPGSTRLTAALLLLAVAGVAWQAVAPEPWQFSRAFLPNKAHFFALGVASRALVSGVPGAWRGYAAVAILAVVICSFHGQGGKLLPPIIWTVCLAAQLRPRLPALGMLHTLLRSRPALWLGAISYPIYLVNEPIQKLLASALSQFAAGNAVLFTTIWLPAATVLPVLCAAWLHRHIEVPAMRWRRRQQSAAAPRADPGRPAAPAAHVAADLRPVTVQGAEPGL